LGERHHGDDERLFFFGGRRCLRIDAYIGGCGGPYWGWPERYAKEEKETIFQERILLLPVQVRKIISNGYRI
jgi:hypothetical protein